MANIANGIIFAWPGTNAAIPSGWSRETALDGYYIQAPGAGANADLVTVRGNANHTHTSPAHTPIQNSHTHNFSAGVNSGAEVAEGAASDTVARSTHNHSTATASNSATGTNNSIAITVDAFTNDLAYVEVIFIKSDGTPTGVPNTAYGFFQSDTLPASWSRVQGDRYLKGAAAGGNGGATGGSNSHTHTSPAHTHTQNAHSHAAKNSANSSHSAGVEIGGPFVTCDAPHTHSVTLNNNTPTNQSVTTTINSTNAEPVFKKINLIANGTGGDSLPDQIVALWGGTNASIPADWARVTGIDGNFPKHANANGESMVTTGGSLTHVHTAANCQPIQNTHNHTASTAMGLPSVSNIMETVSVVQAIPTDDHTHVWTITNTVATNQSTAVTIDVSSSEAAYPRYKQVIFIEYTEPPVAGYQANLALLGVGF